MSTEKFWVQTFRGKKFYPLQPRVEDLDIRDVAHALSNLCRFTGHVKNFYSVAEHCVRVSRRCEELMRARMQEDHPEKKTCSDCGGEILRAAKWGLLHDASEAYLNDLSTPVKRQPELALYRAAEDRLTRVIAERWELGPEPSEVGRADLELLFTERRDLFQTVHPDWDKTAKEIVDPLPIRINGWSPHFAEEKFLDRFLELWGSLDR